MSFENASGKKWSEIEIDPKEDTYESLTLIYYKEANPLVPLVRVGIETPSRMGRS
jgi:hypothetical protein